VHPLLSDADPSSPTWNIWPIYAYFIDQDSGDTLSETARDHLGLLQQQMIKMETMLDDKRYLRVDHSRDATEEVHANQLIADTLDLLDVPPTFTIDVMENLPVLHTPKAVLAQDKLACTEAP
jgi:hypothetical protein